MTSASPGLVGHWFSDSVCPSGTERTGELAPFNGLAYGVIDGHLFAGWQTPDKEDGTGADPVWSVHDLGTGRLQASMTCGYDLNNPINAGNCGSNREYGVVASPNGRYLAAGPVVFDLQRKKGICLARSGDRKDIVIVSIRDDGTAYGAVQQDSTAEGTEPAAVQVDLNEGPNTAKVLGRVSLPHQAPAALRSAGRAPGSAAGAAPASGPLRPRCADARPGEGWPTA
ncbi:hypothetical protein [Streptomyces sp. NPDC003710]